VTLVAWLLRIFRKSDEPVPLTQVVQVVAEPEATARAFHDAALQTLNVHIETFDKIDVRVSTTLTVGSAILPLTYGLLSLSQINHASLTSFSLKVAVFWYVVMLVFALTANSIRLVSYRPDPETLERNSELYDDAILLEWVAREYVASVKENAPKLLQKSKWAGGAEIWFTLEAISLVAATFAALF
jgi:hypothetical protein